MHLEFFKFKLYNPHAVYIVYSETRMLDHLFTDVTKCSAFFHGAEI